jgi:hypothetical protein
MHQLSLFGSARPRPTLEPVDPDGSVVEGSIDVTLRLPHPRLAWDMAAIQLHQHEDSRWMWAIQHANGGYQVGPKWGRFAPSQAAALTYAAGELLDWCDRTEAQGQTLSITTDQLNKIRAWAEALL